VVVVSYSGKEINAKLVYYGCGLSGKTTNLESIYEAVPETSRGKMVSMKTQSDRTLFFDLLPLDLGEIMGFKTRFLLYTVPGQVFYNATRKLVLKGSDAIVFVVDSEVGKMEENKESLANLRANLAELGLSLDNIPWVIQYNKRDLPNVYSVEELNKELNPGGKVPTFDAVATDGKGVFETFRGISHLLMEKVTKDLRRSTAGTGTSRAGAVETGDAAAAARSAATHAAPQEAAAHAGRGVDYGREIELPAERPLSARVAANQAPAPQAARPAPPPPARVNPASAQPPHAGHAPAPPRPAPPSNSTTPAAPGIAASGESEELIVPIQLGKGGSHEIVLRIVLKLGG
jgi:signal recognition particle receptor subunit beta